jgi:lipopolysaccharide transport system permease protein
VARLVIEPGSVARQYWRDLWRYRELFGMLAWRDVSVRYKQTVIGITWAVLRPVFTAIAFTLVFGHLAHLSSDGAPYALMVFAAMLPWQLFSTALVSASDSLITDANLVSKVYFPRLLVPASTVVVALIDFMLGVGVLIVMLALYRQAPPAQIAAVIPLALLAALLALGPGLLLATLNAKYRDFRHALPFITQFGLYITPIGFSSSLVSSRWRLLFECNPMVGVVDGFRWAILDTGEFPGRALSISALVCVVMLAIGINRFRATESTLVDVL